MKNVGIMGGTFNPIHNGHLAMAQIAYDQYQLDQVLFMPSGNSYLKSNVLDSSHRVAMVNQAILEKNYFALSMLEVNRKGNTYTYETLQELTKQNPDTHYYFILGADSLMYIDQWKNPEIIFSLSTILCAVRENYDMNVISKKCEWLYETFHADIKMLRMPQIDISSTKIRDYIKQQKSILEFVPTSVNEYIKKEHLYEKDKEVFEEKTY